MSPRHAAANRAMRLASKQIILDAATAVFGEMGFAATTDAVAKRAGVAKGLVFAYFKTKDRLLEAVIEDKLSEALLFWKDLPQLSGTALLTHIATLAMDRAIAHPAEFRLYFSLFFHAGSSAAIKRVTRRLKPRVEEYYQVIAAALRETASPHPAADAVLFQAALNGMVQNLVLQPELAHQPQLFPRDRMVARLVSSLARK